MKKVIFILITIFTLNGISVAKETFQSAENLVISEKTQLYDSSENAASVLETLTLLDMVYVLDSENVNGKILAKTAKGVKGWIKYNDISYLEKARKIKTVQGLELLSPKDFPLIFKDKKVVGNSYSKNNIKYIFESNYFSVSVIIIHGANFQKIVKDAKESCLEQASEPFFSMPESPVIKDFSVDNLTGSYISWYELHDRVKFYKTNILGKNRKEVYYIRIQMKKHQYTPEEEILAKKILFSARLK